eukprot:GHRQ01036222.1.p2 GENE.GHRQ01036222.1~~GHRQ01036222.1.p2  ORF type:complete len:104 (+),score=27.09 GHRQ01036222.1:83-394(+)
MEAEADLLGMGQHCAMPDCKQLDFLPFKCDCCSRTYCLSHRTYTAHSCIKAGAKTLDVLPCPICAKGIHLRYVSSQRAACGCEAATATVSTGQPCCEQHQQQQ